MSTVECVSADPASPVLTHSRVYTKAKFSHDEETRAVADAEPVLVTRIGRYISSGNSTTDPEGEALSLGVSLGAGVIVMVSFFPRRDRIEFQ